MTFIAPTALVCTTVLAVTIQVFGASSGTKKGSKKSVTSGPLDPSFNTLKQAPVKQLRKKKIAETKKPSKCNILKIHDFVLYPIKAVIPVTDSYKIIYRKNNINSSRRVSNTIEISRRLTKPSRSVARFKVTKKSNKRKSVKSLKKSVKSSKLKTVIKKPSTKRSLKRTKEKSKLTKTVRREISRTKSNLTTKKSLPSVLVNANSMVLTADQFVFKPTIPITEANYPLENTEKLELYAQDSPVDKVLSYGFSDPAIKNYIKFPSVSKIIEETISDKTKQILANWRQKMIDDLGEDGFFNHSEALKVRGTEFHMAVRNAVLGNTTENCSEVTQNSLKSLSWMLEHISNPMAVESTIAHPKLGYRGVADCIAMFRNIPVIIDWKLSDKPKRDLKDTYDAPVQITAYIGALNHDPNYKWGVNHGLVAVAYANGDPCDVFLLAPKHCQIYWRHWLMRFDKFKARSHLHLEHNIDEKSLELI